jgi:uncharacterized protein involved in type VI secretion and phage assembly
LPQASISQIPNTPPLGPNKLLVDTLHIHEALGRLFEIRADLLSEDDSRLNLLVYPNDIYKLSNFR